MPNSILQGNPGGHAVQDRFPVVPRGSKVAFEEVGNPSNVLLGQGPFEAQLLPDRLDLLRSRLHYVFLISQEQNRGVVTGDGVQHHKDEQGNAKGGGNKEKQDA